MAENFFTERRRVFNWPVEYEDILLMLQGKNMKGENTHAPMVVTNAHAVIIAASLGILHNRTKDVGKSKLAIPIETFDSQKFGNTELSSYIGLIFLLSDSKNPDKNLKKLRESESDEDSNELHMIHVVEKYAAGGLEYLRGSLTDKGDSTGELVLETEVLRLYA